MRRRILSALVVGALLAGIGAARGGNGEAPRPVEITGELEIVIAEDFAGGRSQIHYLLRDPAGGRPLPLDLDRPPPDDWATGERVTVKGVIAGGRLRVQEIRRAATPR